MNLRFYSACLLAPLAHVPEPLAGGEAVGPRSLALAPGRVYWSEAGSARMAPVAE